MFRSQDQVRISFPLTGEIVKGKGSFEIYFVQFSYLKRFDGVKRIAAVLVAYGDQFGEVGDLTGIPIQNDRWAQLARKLLEQAKETDGSPASRYVLLREATSIAANAVDVETAMQAVEMIGRHYQVDVLTRKGETLSMAGKNAQDAKEARLVVQAYLHLAKEFASIQVLNIK